MIFDNTLGDILLRRYIADFKQELRRANSMYHNQIKEDTNFGKLLHKDKLWSLYRYKEEKSLLYHLCRNPRSKMELVNNPCNPKNSLCPECGLKAPDEITGLWTLHNFDWIQQSGGNGG